MAAITGIILAGGRARRMGGEDKGLTLLGGKPLISHVIERLQPQVDNLLISANRNLEQYHSLGYPVVSDTDSTAFRGPLAGLAATLRWIETPLVMVTPCDTPLLPNNLVTRLQQALEQEERGVAVARDPQQLQQLCFLAHRTRLTSVAQALQQDRLRVRDWLEAQQPVVTPFPDPFAFTNINTPEERQQLDQQLETTE